VSLNFATSLVATAPSPATSGTSLVVTASDGSKFYVGKAIICPAGTAPTTANAEVVSITAISTDTLTITRARESSTARTVVVGDQIYQGITAAMWDLVTGDPVVIGTGTTAGTGAGTVAIGSNVAMGTVQNAVAIGKNAVAALSAVAIGGGSSATSASGVSSIAIGGANSSPPTSSGTTSVAIGASATLASSTDAVALGRAAVASATGGAAIGAQVVASRVGQFSHGYTAANFQGDAQASRLVLRVSTSNATGTVMLAGGQGSSWLTVSTSRVLSGLISVAAIRTDVSGTAAAWPQITFAAARDSSGNVRLIGTPAGTGTTTFCDAGATTWTVGVSANTTNQSVDITVTGEASKTIRWVATADFTEAA